MIRMQNRNSSCDCGKATKERGSFVSKSKVYETRSGAQIPQENIISGVNDDVITNSSNSKEGKEFSLKKMEQTVISAQPINKSLNYRRSSVNLSKTSINKPCDNKVVIPNGNARSISGDILDANKITNTKDLDSDDLECNCVRSNMNFEDSKHCDEYNISSTENKDESVKVLVEDKQNGDCESCEPNVDGEVKCTCQQKLPCTQNVNGKLDKTSKENSNGVIANGFCNGNKHLHKRNKERLDSEGVKDKNGDSPQDEIDSTDPNLVSDRREKKRKSNFEKIFDSYAEFGCHSDKRRSRRPPVSYSPEPSRRIKLENLFDEKSILTPKVVKKAKVARKPRQKGPIIHYLDLYIKNKDIKLQSLKKEEEPPVPVIAPEEQLIDPANIKKEEEDYVFEEPRCDILSPIIISPTSILSPTSIQSPTSLLSPTSLQSPTPESFNLSSLSNCNNQEEVAKKLTNFLEETKREPSEDMPLNDMAEIPLPDLGRNSNFENIFPMSEELSPRTCPRVPPLPTPMSPDEIPSDTCSNTSSKKKGKSSNNSKSKKAKKEKPKELMYDAEVSRILGYRHNQGKNEFLVLFHNGTSNWVIQKNNVTVIDQYKDYFEHSEHELSTINRLAYFIIKNPEISNEYCSDEEPETIKSPQNGTVPTVPSKVSSVNNSNGPSKGLKDHSKYNSNGTIVSSNGQLIQKGDRESQSIVSSNGQLIQEDRESLNNQPTGHDTDLHVGNNTDNCVENMNYIQNAFSEGFNESMSKPDLNELCNYVMSSRHIKLYPFESNKVIVIKRDDEFMHIYLKNIRKSIDHSQKAVVEDHLDIRSCEKLIYTLEDCAVDDNCDVVVISGVEEYFALKNVFDKLLKKPATIEGRNYEQDVSMLRYLIQTIRNFTKPICAVIKKTATGLPASMLSLFDMVFDERGENFVKKTVNPKPSHKKAKKKKLETRKSDLSTSTDDSGKELNADNFQSYLFPKLMGLTDSNESQIMGEGQRNMDYNDSVSSSYYNKKMLSLQLRKSLHHMKSNTKIQKKSCRGRNQSINSEDDLEETVTEPYYTTTSAPPPPSNVIQANIDNLSKEIEREKELTKRSMDELESILLSIDSY